VSFFTTQPTFQTPSKLDFIHLRL